MESYPTLSFNWKKVILLGSGLTAKQIPPSVETAEIQRRVVMPQENGYNS